MKTRIVYTGIVLATVLWAIMFVVHPFNFWVMMSISTLILGLCAALAYKENLVPRSDWTGKNVLIGVFSAFVLYGVFYCGNAIMLYVYGFLGLDRGQWQEGINSVYGNGEGFPAWLIFLLLLFPIGACEEIFWRGAVQRYFAEQMDSLKALFVTVAIYTAVHLPTGNVALILAAFVCGSFWGAIYYRTKSIVPVLISHALWDPFIFVIAPIH